MCVCVCVRACVHVCRFDPRVVMMVGLFLGAFGFFVLIPMSNEPPELITIASKLTPPTYGKV